MSVLMKEWGVFTQKRVGKNGTLFKMYKIKTMYKSSADHITLSGAPEIHKAGALLKKYKLDELPQIFNVLKGDMSFVGPRPDVEGYANILKGENRIILTVKPGITSPASIKYRNESELLAQQINPKDYNDNVIWPDKVRINKDYIENWSLLLDFKTVLKTIF